MHKSFIDFITSSSSTAVRRKHARVWEGCKKSTLRLLLLFRFRLRVIYFSRTFVSFSMLFCRRPAGHISCITKVLAGLAGLFLLCRPSPSLFHLQKLFFKIHKHAIDFQRFIQGVKMRLFERVERDWTAVGRSGRSHPFLSKLSSRSVTAAALVCMCMYAAAAAYVIHSINHNVHMSSNVFRNSTAHTHYVHVMRMQCCLPALFPCHHQKATCYACVRRRRQTNSQYKSSIMNVFVPLALRETV